ncbi:hypothetical protein ACFPYI_09460 [Halomarina salina]|uniref:Uncharacterized protein n=1 Tax=Halomarina salina TaxID=1872699 RepID=A0ABD5RLN5_9EURY|nr:hypothetical protein [Halomarina salina]
MRLALDDEPPRETDAAELGGRVDRSDVLAAIRGDRDWLDCPPPGPLFEHIGPVVPDVAVRPRTALAVAARTRGVEAPQDDDIRRLRARLDEGGVQRVDTAPLRERVASTSDDVDRLRERVARLQGRVRALREGDGDPSDAEAELSDALSELTERETAGVAARQALQRAREERREFRNRREERRRLDDRIANLERAARRHLVERVEPEFRAAVAALAEFDGIEGGDASGTPDDASTRDTADPFDVPPVVAALAVYRVGDPTAPVVLDCERFPDARTAADWLDGSVIRL